MDQKTCDKNLPTGSNYTNSLPLEPFADYSVFSRLDMYRRLVPCSSTFYASMEWYITRYIQERSPSRSFSSSFPSLDSDRIPSSNHPLPNLKNHDWLTDCGPHETLTPNIYITVSLHSTLSGQRIVHQSWIVSAVTTLTLFLT